MANDEAAGGAPGGATDLPAVAATLKDLAGRIRRARVGGKRIGILVALLLVVVVISVGLRIYGIYADVGSNLDKYQVALMQQMVVLMPAVAGDLNRVAISVAPDFRKALEEDLQENRKDILAKLEKERDLFLEGVKEKTRAEMEKRLKEAVARQEERLAEAFPKLKDVKAREAVVDSLNYALAEATGNLLEPRLEESLALMGEIHEETILFLPDEKARQRVRAATGRLFEMLGEVADKAAAAAPASP